MLLANVILPLSLQDRYTYLIPDDLERSIHVGSRVVVQFGKKKFYTAIVFEIYEANEVNPSTKEIITSLEDYPIITPQQIRFWQWLSTYYMCTLGDVYRAAVPSVLKLESETHIMRIADFEAEEPFNANELAVFNALIPDKKFTISEIDKKVKVPSIISVIKSLVDKKAICINEDIQELYTPKTLAAIRFSKNLSEAELVDISENLSRAKKQQSLFLIFIDLVSQKDIVLKKELLDKGESSSVVLNELVKKGYLEAYNLEIDRIHYGESNMDAANALNEYQTVAYNQIKESFEEKDTTLLFGVTSSGKTEIYIQLIRDAIDKGKQVLYLLPEIALTTQITERLKSIFGNKLAVYHSRFNENERAEVWNKLLRNDDCQIILGARSAIFLPFTNLDLIIVDEEHESSYKQQDPAPRYNAANGAIVLANYYNAKTLLGTATPAIETYYNAIKGRYGLVRLSQRYEGIELPHIETINTKELKRKKLMKSILSPPLVSHIQDALDRKEQIILFQNRRGFASLIECKTCSWVPYCKNCDVSLTYHKSQNILACHYCGATYPVPSECEECKTPTLEILGYGTERIEEEVNETFPEGLVARMDLDTTRGKKSYEKIISSFEQNETNILIGTQMVSKGLDFDNVTTVGILNADSMLNYPDFRAHEKAFQLMTQVSGRAGRKNKQGSVYLQTAHPGNPIINFVKANDYESFFQLQLQERKLFRYPPFYRLIAIIVRGKDENILHRASDILGNSLRQSFGDRVLGPTKPPIGRVQSLYIRKILLKIENQASIQHVRENIRYHQHLVFSNPDFKSLIIHYDVDPV